MKTFLLVAAAMVLLAAAVLFGAWGWMAGGDTQIGAHGWVALTLGVILTIGVGGGLMALVFFSSRHGYDEAAQYRDEDVEP